MKNYDAEIGLRLAELRKRKGYTQTEVGKIIGKSKETVYGYEHGRNNISASTLLKLLELYGKDANEFINEIK